MEDQSEIQKALAQNRKELLEVKQELRKITKQLTWYKVVSILRLLLIIVPIVIGFIYLMPFVNQAVSGYRTILEELNLLQQQPAANQNNDTQGQGNPAELDGFINKFKESNN